MSESKHTPGPWLYRPSEPDIISESVWDVAPSDDPLGYGIRVRILHLSGAMGGHDNNADARLIAASPEMYDLLKEAVSVEERRSTNRWAARVGALLAKIETE